MNQLFERYAVRYVQTHARRNGVRLVPQGPQRYLAYESNGKGRVLMRPDISLLDEQGRILAILDAKWKRIQGYDPIADLSPADLYQLNAYAATYNCDSVGLLYPEQNALPAGRLHQMVLNGLSANLSLQALPVDRVAEEAVYVLSSAHSCIC